MIFCFIFLIYKKVSIRDVSNMYSLGKFSSSYSVNCGLFLKEVYNDGVLFSLLYTTSILIYVRFHYCVNSVRHTSSRFHKASFLNKRLN